MREGHFKSRNLGAFDWIEVLEMKTKCLMNINLGTFHLHSVVCISMFCDYL